MKKDSRAYRFQPGEPVPDAVRRIAVGRIDHALDELRGASDSSPEEAVHEARKDMKKLRALLRLVRDELGNEVFRRENECFRDAARRLSGFRDADVMLATLGGLDGSFAEARRALEESRPAETDGRRRAAAAEVVSVLGEARGRVARWPLRHDGSEAFSGGLRRIYRRGRRALRAVASEPTTENLHEWRKREKDLWYHLVLLRATWPPLLDAAADEAHTLSERLGEDHDLAVLHDWAHAHLDRSALDGVDEALEPRRAALQAEALDLGRRLYVERPGAFAARLGGYWAAWRAGLPRPRPVAG